MYITFRDLSNTHPTTISNISFCDDYPHAATPLWADPAMTQYILFAEVDLWEEGGTIVRDGVAYTLHPETRSTTILHRYEATA